MVFTHAIHVNVIPDEDTLAGYKYEVKKTDLLPDLIDYFSQLRIQNLKTWGIYNQWSTKDYTKGDYLREDGSSIFDGTSETTSSAQTSPTAPDIIFNGDVDSIYLPDKSDETAPIEIDTTQNPIIILPDEKEIAQSDSRGPTFSNVTVNETHQDEVSGSYIHQETVVDTYTTTRNFTLDEGCDIKVQEITTNTVTRNTTTTSQREKIPAKEITKVVTFEGVNYYIYSNGNVTTEDGEFVVQNGWDGILSYIQNELVLRKDTWPKNVWYGSNQYTVYKNGTAVNEEGEVITEEGFSGLESVHQKPYHIYAVSGKEYHIYENGTVTSINGTTILGEGSGLEKLIEHLQKSSSIYVINDNLRLFIDEDGVVTFANGTVLCDGGIDEVEHTFMKHFEQQYAYIKTSNGEIFFYDPISGNQYNSQGELVDKDVTNFEALESLGEAFNFFVYDNVTYRLYYNGNVTDKSGVNILSSGGFDGFWKAIKQAKVERDYDTYVCNGQTFTSYKNGTVFNEEGEAVVLEEGIKGCTHLMCEKNKKFLYTQVSTSDNSWRIYKDCSVSWENGTQLLAPAEGCLNGLIKWLTRYDEYQGETEEFEEFYDTYRCRDITFFIYENGTVYNNQTGVVDSTDGGLAWA